MIDFLGYQFHWMPKLNSQSQLPLYIQIANQIESDIQTGILKIGDQLPPQRIVAEYLNLNHSTVTKAFKLCEEKGIIKGTIGKGTFVSSMVGVPSSLITLPKPATVIELGMLLPLYEMNSLIQEHVNAVMPLLDASIAYEYTLPEGNLKHRYVAAKWLMSQNIIASTDTTIITAGTQNALAAILLSKFNKGDRLIVDEYTYSGIVNLAQRLGIILLPVTSTAFGINLDHVKTTLKREKVKGIYLISDCHNPSTISLSIQLRKDIAEVVVKYNLVLIEDGTFRFSNASMPPTICSFCPDHGYYIYGTSKSINPTLRVSYLIAPKSEIKALSDTLYDLTWMTSPLTAEITSLLQATGRFDQIINDKITKLEERNQLTDTLLKNYNIRTAPHSMYRLIEIDSTIDDLSLEKKCYDAGVQVFSMKRFSSGNKTSLQGIRIAISSPNSISELEEGLTLLNGIL